MLNWDKITVSKIIGCQPYYFSSHKYKGNLKSLKKEIKKIAKEEISDDKKKKAIRNTFFYFIIKL